MARLRKYNSKAEKDEARRLQTKANVRAHRERQKSAWERPPHKFVEQNQESSDSREQSYERLPVVFKPTSGHRSIASEENALSLRHGRASPASTPSGTSAKAINEIVPDMPEELVMKNASLTTGGLLRDFMDLTGCDLTWWPYASVYSIGDSAGDLLSSSQVAAHALCVAVRKQDVGLQNIAVLAYHDAIAQLRKSLDDYNIQRHAVRLLLAACMCTIYEVSMIIRIESSDFDYTRSTQPLWLEHLKASGIIVQQAGPRVFSQGLGSRVLMGVIPRLLWTASRTRQEMFLASDEWLSLLKSVPKTAIKDGIWPIAVQVPGLMQRFDILQKCMSYAENQDRVSSDIQSLYITLYQQVDRLDSELDDWLQGFQNARHYLPIHKLYWSSTSMRRKTTVFSPDLDFATLAVAEVMMLYWTYKLQLAILASDIETNLMSQGASCLPGSKTHDPNEYARLICQAAVYWIESYAWADVLFICFSFPLRVAANWFARQGDLYQEELACCYELSRSMRQENKKYGRTTEYCLDVVYSPLCVR